MNRARSLDMRPPCPGTASGHPCALRRRLIASSRDGRCAACRAASPAVARGGEVIVLDVPRDVADTALDRVRPLCRQELRLVVAPELLDQLMLSCYQQGLVDGDQLAKREARA